MIWLGTDSVSVGLGAQSPGHLPIQPWPSLAEAFNQQRPCQSPEGALSEHRHSSVSDAVPLRARTAGTVRTRAGSPSKTTPAAERFPKVTHARKPRYWGVHNSDVHPLTMRVALYAQCAYSGSHKQVTGMCRNMLPSMKNIGFHTRLCSDNTCRVTRGSFGGAIDMETVNRLVKSHFDVIVKDSGRAVFVDRQGREVALYLSVDASSSDKGVEAMKAYRKQRAAQEREAEERREREEDEIYQLTAGLSHDEVVRRLRGAS